MQKHTTRPRHYSRAAAADTTAQNATTNNTEKAERPTIPPGSNSIAPPDLDALPRRYRVLRRIRRELLAGLHLVQRVPASCSSLGASTRPMSPGDQERSLTVVNLFSFIIAFLVPSSRWSSSSSASSDAGREERGSGQIHEQS